MNFNGGILESNCCNAPVKLVDDVVLSERGEYVTHWKEQYECTQCSTTGWLEIDKRGDSITENATGILQ